MLAVALSEKEAEICVNSYGDGQVVVACINSPHSTTLSGPEKAIMDIKSQLSHDNIPNRILRVKTAYHSPMMKAIAEDYRAAIADINHITEGSLPMFSSVSGGLANPQTVDANYWITNLLSPVRFTAAVECLLEGVEVKKSHRKAGLSVDAFLEIGPHSALQTSLRQIAGLDDKAKQVQVTYQSVLQRGQGADITALEAVGRLWSRGHPVDIAKANKADALIPSAVDMPSYPW